MASVIHQGGLWQVHMGGEDQSEVTVQVHMSAEMAERLARRETDRLKELNPGALTFLRKAWGRQC